MRVLHTDHDGAPHTGYRGCCLNVMELLCVSWEFHSTFDSVHCASLWSDRSSGSIWHHNASQEAVQRCEMASNNNNTESSSISWRVKKQNLRSLEEDFLLFLQESCVVQSNSTCSSANQITAHLEPIEDLCYLIYPTLVNPSLALFETVMKYYLFIHKCNICGQIISLLNPVETE